MTYVFLAPRLCAIHSQCGCRMVKSVAIIRRRSDSFLKILKTAGFTNLNERGRSRRANMKRFKVVMESIKASISLSSF